MQKKSWLCFSIKEEFALLQGKDNFSENKCFSAKQWSKLSGRNHHMLVHIWKIIRVFWRKLKKIAELFDKCFAPIGVEIQNSVKTLSHDCLVWSIEKCILWIVSPELNSKLKTSLWVQDWSQISETQQTGSPSEKLWVFAKICRYVFFALDQPQQLFLPKRPAMNKWLIWLMYRFIICYNSISKPNLSNFTV